MPIYAFRCQACNNAFDRLQKLSDPDPDVCPECGAHAIRRQVTAPAFRLAGSGWYETDFKGKGEKKHNLAGGAPPAGETPAATPAAPASGSGSAEAAPAGG